MKDDNRNLDTALDGLDAERRAKTRRLIVKSAFATPVVASFAMAAMSVERAAAQSNTTNSSSHEENPSDRRLKRDVVQIGRHADGFGIYRFRYAWGDTHYVGVMAQEVRETRPEAVVVGDGGYLRVNYAALGMKMTPAAPLGI